MYPRPVGIMYPRPLEFTKNQLPLRSTPRMGFVIVGDKIMNHQSYGGGLKEGYGLAY